MAGDGVILTNRDQEVQREINRRVASQGGIATYYDNYILALARKAQATQDPLTDTLEIIDRYITGSAQKRLQDPRERLRRPVREVVRRMGVPWATYTANQGVSAPLTWRSRDLFKTAYDLAVYPMLISEVEPLTIIELGSGTGASALWLADTSESLSQPPRIISLDIHPPTVSHPRVKFIEADIRNISDYLTTERLSGFAHPWLVIEDAHVNVDVVLTLFDSSLTSGDYLIVEDSLSKRDALLDLILENNYLLDTRYVDFFGENATCAIDSIFIRR